MKKILTFFLVTIRILSFCQENEFHELGKSQNIEKSAKTQGSNSKMDNYDVVYYGLNIEATNANKIISSGIVTIKAKVVGSPLSEFVIQLITALSVTDVKLNGLAVSFNHTNDEISFTCPAAIATGELFTVVVTYSGSPQGSGWRNGPSGWGPQVTYTLSESFHAYEWFPVKQSLTDKADSADIYITVPSGLKAASNGLLKQIVDVGGGKSRYEWQCRYPIDYYLISVTISDYVEYDTYANPAGLGKPLLIQNFVYNGGNCLDQFKSTIDGTAAIIELYSNLFGMYPFSNEKYGHVMAPIGGGMEHQTMTSVSTFTNGLIAHELAHMWFGDLVTCKTWQDIWINEGFASYAEYLNLQNLSNQANANSWMISAHTSSKQVANGSVYLGLDESTDENRIFSSQLSYKKGASIIHMLRFEINNDEVFFNILKQFLQRYGHSTASGENFKSVVNELTGKDYSWFFDQWYYGYGYPMFTILYGFTDGKPWVTVSQSPSSSLTQLFKTAMELKLTHEDNSTSIQRINITQNPQTFTFDLPKIKSLQVDPNNWLLFQLSSVTSTLLLNSDDVWVSVSPNPVTDKIQVSVSDIHEMAGVTITNISGKIFYQSNFLEHQFEIDASKLPRGVYIIKLTDGNRLSTQKFVKE